MTECHKDTPLDSLEDFDNYEDRCQICGKAVQISELMTDVRRYKLPNGILRWEGVEVCEDCFGQNQ